MPSFTGDIYDLDFIANLNSCQALLRNGTESIAVVTEDPRAVTVLATGMTLRKPVEVAYSGDNPKRLDRAKLNLG